MRNNQPVTSNEILPPDDQPLVSRTDTGGRIAFVNQTFIDISGFTHDELIGQPHSVVRHPDMPQQAFADLWATIKAGRPWEGLVKNRTKTGDFYWVRANVTPVVESGTVTGYISIRSKPTREMVRHAEAVYARLRTGQGKGDGLLDGQIVRTGILRWCATALASVTGRLAAAVLVAALTMVLVGMIGLRGTNQSAAALRQIYEGSVADLARVTAARAAMRSDVAGVVQLTERLQADPTRRDSDTINALRASANHIDTQLAGLLHPQALAAVDADHQFAGGQSVFVHQALLPVLDKLQTGTPAEAAAMVTTQLKPMFKVSESTINRMVANAVDASKAAFSKAESNANSAFWQVILVVLAELAAIAGANLLTLRAIQQPVRRICDGFEAIARNNLAQEIEIPAAREFWHIARRLRALRAMLNFAAQERVERERQAETDRREALREMAERVERDTDQSMEKVVTNIGTMSREASAMAELAQSVSANANSVAQSAGVALANAQSVGAASEELSASIQEISSQVSRASEIAQRAVRNGDQAKDCIRTLSTAAGQIGDVVRLIETIAEQTNLLALNATIEAARAGEAGRGFNVVASEVKSLAGQTARSTSEVARQIAAIQGATHDAVATVNDLGQAVLQMAEVSSSIAAAIEEQASATSEIARNVVESSQAAQAVTERIDQVSRDASASLRQADALRDGSLEAAKDINVVRSNVMRTIRTAMPETDRREQPRATIAENCTISVDGRLHDARLQDISHAGARITTTAVFPPGARGTLSLNRSGVDARANFRVAANHPDGDIGLTFEEGSVSSGLARIIQVLTASVSSRAA